MDYTIFPYLFAVFVGLVVAVGLYSAMKEEIRKMEERQSDRLESKLWEKKKGEVQKILEQHKRDVQDILDRTVNKLTRAFEAAMVKKAERTKEGRVTMHRSIDED